MNDPLLNAGLLICVGIGFKYLYQCHLDRAEQRHKQRELDYIELMQWVDTL